MTFELIRRWRIHAFAGMLATFATPAWADDTLPPIRRFDIPTIEKLGRQMYEQDQEAWKATDILRAKHSDDELKAGNLHGWIVDPFLDRDVVRFIHDGANGPEAFYDVTFAKGAEPVLSEPQNRVLNSEELAQYSARTWALKNVERPCSDRYNTIVLKDLERNGWLVWALAATTEPGVVLYGGHYTFSISKDGKTVVQRDALSKGCMNAPPPDPTKGNMVMMAFIQLVSDVPVETVVWLNLEHKLPVMIITPDRKEWTITDGHISQTGALTARAQASPEERK